MLIHCTIDELLAVRAGRGSTAALEHLDGCEDCRNELDRLHQRVARLKALPTPRAPRDRWDDVRQRVVAGRRRVRYRRLGLGTAAVAALAALGFGFNAVGPRFLDVPAPAEEHYVTLVEESQSLEDLLRRIEPDTRVLNGRTASTVVALEDQLMVLDARLAEARRGRRSLDDLIYLMERRVQLMEGLVGVHATKSTYVGF